MGVLGINIYREREGGRKRKIEKYCSLTAAMRLPVSLVQTLHTSWERTLERRINLVVAFLEREREREREKSGFMALRERERSNRVQCL